MCRTQQIIENVAAKRDEALKIDNEELAEKLELSIKNKIIRLVYPTTILYIKTPKVKGDFRVTKVLSKKENKCVFFEGVLRQDGKKMKLNNSHIVKFVKDAEQEYINADNKKKKKKAGKNFATLKRYTLEQYMDEIYPKSNKSQRKRQWAQMIFNNKLTCPVTGLKVAYCGYDVTSVGSYHYNFYSECGKMFTVDHIIPKSKGGSVMKLNNLQPMIAKFNWSKGSTDNEQYIKDAKYTYQQQNKVA